MPGPGERHDVLVVGAGPAGIATALRAHERGLRVVVVDKATFPRDKTCGDGLTTGALRLLERLGVDAPAVEGYQPVEEVVLVDPTGRRVTLPMPADGQHSAVVPRLALDAALLARARAVGIDVREGVELTGLDTAPDGTTATVADGQTLEAAYVVAADGHWSWVRRTTNPEWPRDLGTWHAFRQYFRGVDDRRQWVIFEPDLLPGYAWVFPLPGGRANVGFGVLRDADLTGKALKELWIDLLDRPVLRDVLGPGAVAEDAHRAWPIPAAFDAAHAADGRVLYVGDAANVVDPMTGEGIAQALETGLLAADAIVRSVADPAHDAAASYRRAVSRALGRDLRFAAALQRILRHPVGAQLAIRAAGLTPWTRRNFARWMFEDYPRALVLTPDRWQRGMFTPAGAYTRAG